MDSNEKINKYDHLVELSDSDFEIADGEPNIKGWRVENESGETIGDVADLLFDPESRKVRYLIVDLDDNQAGRSEHKTVLIPIGIADLYNSDGQMVNDTTAIGNSTGIEDEDLEQPGLGDKIKSDREGDLVVVPATAAQLNELPAYVKGNVTPATESDIRYIFEGSGALPVGYDKENFYGHDHFNEDKFYQGKKVSGTEKLPVIEENLEIGKHEVETGRTRITSRIVARPVEESISLKEEHISVERTPVNRPVSAADPNIFKEEELEITEYGEVPVITKEARVIEEVEINKEVAEREEIITETLRNTEVEAERIEDKRRS